MVERLVKANKWEHQKWLQSRSREAYKRYKCVMIKVKREVRQAKKEGDVRWGEKLMDDFSRNKRMLWKEVKRTRKGIEVKKEFVMDVNVVTSARPGSTFGREPGREAFKRPGTGK